MNERLKELMLEAGYAAPEMAGRANKLAELIVRECADVANQHMEHNEGTDYNVGGKIKKHFGVEE